MRILAISNLYPPNVVGGYEVLCADVNEGLDARGHEVTVLTSCYGGRSSEGRPVTVHQALQLVVGQTIYEPFPGGPRKRAAVDRANIAGLLRCLDMTRPDVVFCWNLFGLDASFLDALGAAPVPVVMMLTDNWLAAALNPEFVAKYFERGVYAPRGESFLLQTARPGRHLNASAIFGAEFMRGFYAAAGVGFRSERVIHNGVKQSEPAPLRDRSHIGENGTVALLFAGRVVEIKGVHVALEALSLLRAERPGGLDFNLVVVGDTVDAAYRSRLSRIAIQRGCSDRVQFLGLVPQDRLFQLFQDHDFYLFPSLYEPFSLTLIHALAAGIPTVASRVGGNVEIVADGETGLLAERNDPESLAAAVIRLCADTELRLRVAELGRKTAADLTFERMLLGMEDFLMTVAG